MADIVIYTNRDYVIEGMTKCLFNLVKRSRWNEKSELPQHSVRRAHQMGLV